jgi:hypothetical protein
VHELKRALEEDTNRKIEEEKRKADEILQEAQKQADMAKIKL